MTTIAFNCQVQKLIIKHFQYTLNKFNKPVELTT